jgi:hypothetical protein
MGDVAAWIAAVAAVAAAAIVSWQSYETRRSVQAAVEGLRLSRQQVNEAIRSRIDAAMPVITVTASRPDWPPVEPSAFRGEAQPLLAGPQSPTLFMPRDADRRIAVRARVVVRNNSAQHVLVLADGLLPSRVIPVDQDLLEIAPGETLEGTMEVDRTLRDWVTIYASRSSGDPGPKHRATITYLGHGDTSATDIWTIMLSGTPIEPVDEFDAGWRVSAEPSAQNGSPASMGTGVAPSVRTYYLSKTRNEKLIDI